VLIVRAPANTHAGIERYLRGLRGEARGG